MIPDQVGLVLNFSDWGDYPSRIRKKLLAGYQINQYFFKVRQWLRRDFYKYFRLVFRNLYILFVGPQRYSVSYLELSIFSQWYHLQKLFFFTFRTIFYLLNICNVTITIRVWCWASIEYFLYLKYLNILYAIFYLWTQCGDGFATSPIDLVHKSPAYFISNRNTVNIVQHNNHQIQYLPHNNL